MRLRDLEDKDITKYVILLIVGLIVLTGLIVIGSKVLPPLLAVGGYL